MKKTPVYFPIERGLYEIAPGLKPLGFDFGNDYYDNKIFHITEEFQDYRKNMIECRDERLSKYFCTDNLSLERTQCLTKFIVERLILESPHLFSIKDQSLTCLHTGDILEFDLHFNLVNFTSKDIMKEKVTHPLDALSLQLQEDIALMCRENSEKGLIDHLAMIHLCSASHWAAEDKIGRNFFDIHVPIPGIEKINKIAEKLVETIIHKGPFVRFIWSFVTDLRLNHHPIAPPGHDLKIWKGRSFNESLEIPFYFRIERQVTYGFAELEMSLFTIGVSFLSGIEVKNNPTQKTQLLSALHSMTPESRVYKGVDGCFDELVRWLEN